RRHTRSKRDLSSDVCSSDLLINVWTVGLSTHGVEGGVGYLTAQVLVFRTHCGSSFKPFRSRLTRHLGVACLNPKQFATFSLRDGRHWPLLYLVLWQELVLEQVAVPDDIPARL